MKGCNGWGYGSNKDGKRIFSKETKNVEENLKTRLQTSKDVELI